MDIINKHSSFQRILDRCGMWSFNAFTLENVAGGRSLPVLCVHLFHWYGLLDHFRLDVVRIWKLFSTYHLLLSNFSLLFLANILQIRSNNA